MTALPRLAILTRAEIAPCDLVLDEQRQEVGIGELTVDGFTVTCFEGVEDAGQSQTVAIA
ncbi:hypothetical protein AWB78_08387 [Caballeronia calidae]|uniref:Uncharacterized protein n=1 Tax=Caballeronia calidae TaxID=1777139 RepID=A0A158EJQ2_9BURK|nr:hypothetical protein AWB78_08387 [Caballeronia calidae]